MNSIKLEHYDYKKTIEIYIKKINKLLKCLYNGINRIMKYIDEKCFSSPAKNIISLDTIVL